MKLKTNSPKETYDLGFVLGKYSKPGEVICIEGEMGAGKTALSQGIIRGLGITDKYITSPTYTLVNEYTIDDLSIYHFDIYRVADYDELLAIGFEEYLREDSVAIIEWADLIGEYLPENKTWLTIERDPGENVRTISIEGLKTLKSEPFLKEIRKWECK